MKKLILSLVLITMVCFAQNKPIEPTWIHRGRTSVDLYGTKLAINYTDGVTPDARTWRDVYCVSNGMIVFEKTQDWKSVEQWVDRK